MRTARKPGPAVARRQALLLAATLLALTAVAAGVERYRLAGALAQAADAPAAAGPAAEAAGAEAAAEPPAGAEAGAEAGEAAAQAPVDEVTDAELEAQLEAVEAMQAGRPDVSEQAAEKPLPADLPVALPSDI
jgi:hypothetical protein